MLLQLLLPPCSLSSPPCQLPCIASPLVSGSQVPQAVCSTRSAGIQQDKPSFHQARPFVPLCHRVASAPTTWQCPVAALLLIKPFGSVMGFPPSLNQWSWVQSPRESRGNLGCPGRGGRAERSCRHTSKAAGCSGDFQQSRNPPCKTHGPGQPAGTGLNKPLEPAPLGSSHASATLASAACSVISPWAAASGCGNTWASNWAPAAAAVGSQRGHAGQGWGGQSHGFPFPETCPRARGAVCFR